MSGQLRSAHFWQCEFELVRWFLTIEQTCRLCYLINVLSIPLVIGASQYVTKTVSSGLEQNQCWNTVFRSLTGETVVTLYSGADLFFVDNDAGVAEDVLSINICAVRWWPQTKAILRATLRSQENAVQVVDSRALFYYCTYTQHVRVPPLLAGP